MARVEADNYPTPHWCYEALGEALQPDSKFLIRTLEPCCGDGRIAKWLWNHWQVTSFDIRSNPSIDYLKWKAPHNYDYIITNPPYRKAFQFVKKAYEEATCTVMLLKLDFLGSETRREWLDSHKPTGLYVLSSRPSFTPDQATDMHNYAWFVWDKTNGQLSKTGIHFIRKPVTVERTNNDAD